VPDPDSEAKFGTVLSWTPVNAIAAGKTDLLIAEAERYRQELNRAGPSG
jgi:hypothetical protein